MAKKNDSIKTDENDFSQELIDALNKEHQTRIAWNLGTDISPTHVKRWISTGSRLLDYAISNRRNGGYAEGRIVEIFGPPSIGKSHLATQAAISTQSMGGVVVYIDTENATNPDTLTQLGIDVSKNFVYAEPSCIEDVFKVVESTITRVKTMSKDVPVTIVWDSVAATPPKAEILAEVDKDGIGQAARAISKGMRRITQMIGASNVLFICLNQIRYKIGTLYGDPTCVEPYSTKVKIRRKLIDDALKISQYLVEDVYLSELAEKEFGIKDFSSNNIGIYDFENEIEVLSQKDGELCFSKISSLIIKDNVEFHYKLNDLLASSSHRVFYDGKWIEMKEHPDAQLVEKTINIVDISVPETQCYFANGYLNHNTTSGGMAIPFHASTRIQLIGGSKIEKDGELIGINVEAKLVKNKVAAPFRRVNFQIHFGVGIKDHEETFDILREYCDSNGPQEVDGKHVSISGKGAWKSFTVADSLQEHDLGKFSLEKKFYKEKFNELWDDVKYKEYLERLLEIALVKTPKQSEQDIKKEALEKKNASDVQTFE